MRERAVFFRVFAFAEKFPFGFKNVGGQILFQSVDDFELRAVELAERHNQPVPAKANRHPQQWHQSENYRRMQDIFGFNISHDAHDGGVEPEEKFVCFVTVVRSTVENMQINAVLLDIMVNIPVRIFFPMLGMSGY